MYMPALTGIASPHRLRSMTPMADLGRYLTAFVDQVSGVDHAIAVSAGGLLTASCAEMPRDDGDQLAAIASGLVSLTQGAARCFEGGPVLQTVVEMDARFLLLMSTADGSSLAVLADRACDVGEVGYEMAMLLDRLGDDAQAPATLVGR
jgi:predicted regulator of Ras-like GTPase activity (Roadblock/LC7/MglB family)